MKKKTLIRFRFSQFCEYIHLEYVRGHAIYREQILALTLLHIHTLPVEKTPETVCGSLGACLPVNVCAEFSSNLQRSGVKVFPPSRQNQAKYAIRILVAAPQECVNTDSPRSRHTEYLR